MRKIIAFLCAFVLALSLCITSFAVTLDYQGHEIKIGSLHDLNADVKYSWLNKLVLREEAMAVTTARLVPHAPYPYSRTYEEFLADVADCMELYSYDTDTVTETYEEVVDLLYYTAVALEMTDDMDTMLSTISKSGIRIPVNMTAREKIEASVIYAAMKYDLTYALFKNRTVFSKGRSIDGAVVDILAAAMKMNLPSGVDTIEGLAMVCCKEYAESFEDLPMSDNPTKEELFYLMEMIASNKAGYSVPIVEYGDATDVQKQYIDCTYYSTVLDTVYSIHINPLRLAEAAASRDVMDIARLVLETMLDEDGVDYENEEAVENLFKLACENGRFEIDEDFYSDVFNYDLYVGEDCEKLWVTPFGLASQIDGDDKFLKVKIGDKTVGAGSTTFFPLDPSKKNENLVVTSTYEDEDGNADMSVYIFNIIKEKKKERTADSDVVAKIERMLVDVVPEGNEKAEEIVSGVISSVDDLVSEGESALSIDDSATKPSVPSDKIKAGTEEATTYKLDESVSMFESTTLSDFEYFSQLIDETYGDKERLTSEYDAASEATTEGHGALSGVAEVVRENPEVVVAPTGVVAVGALAGYLFTRRKKTVSGENGENDFSDLDSDE